MLNMGYCSNPFICCVLGFIKSLLTMKKKTQLSIFALFCLFLFQINAQTFLNGSFETTTASSSCLYAYPNSTFSSIMSNTNAYGSHGQMDILSNTCAIAIAGTVSGIPHGTRAIAIRAHGYYASTGANRDEVALRLSGPLTVGTPYNLSFWSYGNNHDPYYSSVGNLEIGISTVNNAFGTLVGVVSAAAATWTNHTVTFTPTTSGINYITVRHVVTSYANFHNSLIDNFMFITPLAVELVSFEATVVRDQTVELNWVTSNKTNSDYFTIEKSSDGINWLKLGEYKAAGFSNSKKMYMEDDMHPFSGISYYRLSQTDYDGSVKSFTIRPVDLPSDDLDQINIYPNPAGDQLIIEAGLQNLELIRFFDVTGKDVTENVKIQPNVDHIDCDVTMLRTGVYIIQAGDKRVTINKL